MASSLSAAFYDKGKVVLVQPFGANVRLGSVGYLEDGQWIEVSTAKKMFGLDLSVAAGSSNPNSFDGKSGKNLKFETHLDGEVSTLVPKLADAKARAEITFASEGSFVMSVKDQTVSQVGELAEVMAAIRYAYRNRSTLPEGKSWEKKYAVIIGIASAASVTALASKSSSATAVITGSAKVTAPTSPADLDASMNVSYSKSSVDKLWVGPAAGYAFQALVIKPSIFKRWDKEDIVPLKGLGIAPGAPAPSKRPASYVDWAEGVRLEVTPKAAELLAPSGTGKGELPTPPRGKVAQAKTKKTAKAKAKTKTKTKTKKKAAAAPAKKKAKARGR